jgi:predicted transcriptional regulator
MPLHAKFSARLTVSVDPEMKQKISTAANAEVRSDADIVREALDEYFDRRESKEVRS